MFRRVLALKSYNFTDGVDIEWKNQFFFKFRTLTRSSMRLENKKIGDSNEKSAKEVPGILSTRYEPFSEETAPLILDIEEERRKINQPIVEKSYDPFAGISLKKGVRGVLDVEEVVEILRQEKGEDIFVAKIPEDMQYAEYMVIATGKSSRHMSAICQFIRKVYKMRVNPNDQIPLIEGQTSSDWKALDLDNIILHVFSPSARKYYDLETLWSVGKKYDKLLNQKESTMESVLGDYATMLAELEPNKSKT